MSCRFCNHFYRDEAIIKKYPESENGFCSLNPNHIPVFMSHYCGQITLKTYWMPSGKSFSPINHHQERFIEANNNFYEEKEKRLILEKKLKKLRDSKKTQTVKKPETI